MQQADDQSGKRKTWLIIFVVTLFVLAIFWSVDTSVLYILLGFAAFSLYKVFAYRKQQQDDYEPSYRETYRQQNPSFWSRLQKLFATSGHTHSHDRQQAAKLAAFIIAGSVGFIFFIIILSAVFSDDSAGRAEDLRQQATGYYDRQEYDSAAYFYGQAIQADPGNADLHLERGNAFLYAGKNDSAMMEYDEALTLRPSYKEANYNRGLVYYYRKQYRSSIDEVKKALQTDPDYADAMVLIGDGFYGSSQLDSALVWYESAYHKGYRSPQMLHIMAYVYDTKGYADQAIPFYKEALSLDSTRTEIYARLGELVGGEEGNQYRQKAAQYQ